MSGKHLMVLALMFCVAFGSYQKNLFYAASNWWFGVHATMPEQFVLDGILHAEATGQTVPGRYIRAHNDDPRALYAQHDRSGDFLFYQSQYGLQVKLFAALASIGLDEVWQMESVASALMALMVLLMVLLVARDFSRRSAAAVAFIFIFSPWVVIFARNLFFVPFTWLLPLVIAMYFSIRAYESPTAKWRMLLLLYAAILLKLLCGYEFFTGIIAAAFCPLLYQGLAMKVPLKRIFNLSVLFGFISLIAFLTSMFILIGALAPTRAEGFEIFTQRAARRLYSEDPQVTARRTCPGDAECEKLILASLTASPLDVVKIYLVMPEFLPWLSTMRLSEAQRTDFKHLVQNKPTLRQKLMTVAASPPAYWFFVLAKVLNPFAFFVFIFTTIAVALRSGRAMQWLWLCSFLAPISWFVAAKGFCYIHDHLCFVAWYLPFIPYGTIMLCEKMPTRWWSREDSNLRPSV